MTDAAPRHQQRERALSLLYEAELKGEGPLQVVDALPVAPDPYVRTLSSTPSTPGRRPTAASPAPRSDGRSSAWRSSTASCCGWPSPSCSTPTGPPPAVVIDEAVELAKEYSTDESGRFVNGILSTIAADIGPRAGTRGRIGAVRGAPGALEFDPDREVSPVRLTRQEEQWPNANAVIRDPSGACSWPTPRS